MILCGRFCRLVALSALVICRIEASSLFRGGEQKTTSFSRLLRAAGVRHDDNEYEAQKQLVEEEQRRDLNFMDFDEVQQENNFIEFDDIQTKDNFFERTADGVVAAFIGGATLEPTPEPSSFPSISAVPSVSAFPSESAFPSASAVPSASAAPSGAPSEETIFPTEADTDEETAFPTQAETPNEDAIARASGTFGDPHVVTFDGVFFDCQGQGEFVMIESQDSDFVMQERFTSVNDNCGQASVSTGFVIREPGVPPVQVSIPRAATNTTPIVNDCPVDFYFDETAIAAPNNMTDLGNVTITLNKDVDQVIVDFVSDMFVIATVRNSNQFGCFLRVQVVLPLDYLQNETLAGLLGTPNGKKWDDWTNRTGFMYTIPDLAEERYFQPAYDYCVSSWCIDDENESLFTYRAPEESFASISGCSIPYNASLQIKIEDELSGTDDTLRQICCGGSSLLDDCEFGCIADGVCGAAPDAINALDGLDAIDDLQDLVMGVTAEPTPEPSSYPSEMPTMEPTPFPTVSSAPSQAPSSSPAPTISEAPSESPSPSAGPTISDQPSDVPSVSPSSSPSGSPTSSPTGFPSSLPSEEPSISEEPSSSPSTMPSLSPSDEPSQVPSEDPTASLEPSSAPSKSPMPTISAAPSQSPAPSSNPTISDQPSDVPSDAPSNVPSVAPTENGANPGVTPVPTFAPSVGGNPGVTPVPTFAPSEDTGKGRPTPDGGGVMPTYKKCGKKCRWRKKWKKRLWKWRRKKARKERRRKRGRRRRCYKNKNCGRRRRRWRRRKNNNSSSSSSMMSSSSSMMSSSSMRRRRNLKQSRSDHAIRG